MKKLDIVFTFVDGNNSSWLLKKKKYYKKYNNPEINCVDCNKKCRFESRNELLYSLRSIQKHVTGFDRIFIVCDHEPPLWLNVLNPRLVIIRHEDIKPMVPFIPTFNSNGIECHLHEIPGISQRFVYMNDDILFMKDIDLSQWAGTQSIPFITDNCLSKTGDAVTSDIGFRAAWKNTNKWLDERFGHQRRNKMSHSPMVVDTLIIREIWELCMDELTTTSRNKFRSITDFNLTCGLYPYFTMYNGKGYVDKCKVSNTVYMTDSMVEEVVKMNGGIKNLESFDFLCIEDSAEDLRGESNRFLSMFYEELFPVTSSFEK